LYFHRCLQYPSHLMLRRAVAINRRHPIRGSRSMVLTVSPYSP
jgi:hypothetical protein